MVWIKGRTGAVGGGGSSSIPSKEMARGTWLLTDEG